MASAQTPEARELALVGKVEMRIALADSEKKLEDLLKLYLAPLLLKLSSESAAVRNKVNSSTALLVFLTYILLGHSSLDTANRGFLFRSYPSAST